MAKREIEEINAGSMADIAFLLLIFFLVTTTMDKDTAYIRHIPKKVISKNPPAEIQERDVLAIKANDKNQLMVRGEIFNDPNKISDFVLKFYRTNEKQNDPSNNFPMYSKGISMAQIDQQIDKADQQLTTAEEVGAEPAMIEFYASSIAEWEKKKTALRTLGAPVLKEISGQAHIRIEVQQRTNYEIFAKIQTEIEEALYELRNDKAMELWGVSYGTLQRKVAQEKNSARAESEKLELLRILYPDKIIEVTPKS